MKNMWLASVVASLLFIGALTPPETDAAAAPIPCCGRFAAGALGFAGGFLVGRHRRWHHGGCGGCGGGCGGCGGGCGWCGGGYYGRKRRSLDEVMENEVLEDLYWQIANQDRDQCGLRLVCELAEKDPNELTGDETLVLLPYRAREISAKSTYYFAQYDKAAWHGQQGHPCSELYPLCGFTVTDMMFGFRPNITESSLWGEVFEDEEEEE